MENSALLIEELTANPAPWDEGIPPQKCTKVHDVNKGALAYVRIVPYWRREDCAHNVRTYPKE